MPGCMVDSEPNGAHAQVLSKRLPLLTAHRKALGNRSGGLLHDRSAYGTMLPHHQRRAGHVAELFTDLDFTNPDDPLNEEPERRAIESADRYKKMFDESRTALDEARRRAELARDYYDDKQLSRKARALLRQRGQPETIRNRIKPAVNGILGILQQRKVDPRGLPRNPQDDNAADVCSKSLRYVGDSNQFHSLKIDAADNHLVEGIAVAIVDRADASKRQKIPIVRIPFSEYFYDPRSREADFSDATYQGIAKWMFADAAARAFPEWAEELKAAAEGSWSTQFGAFDSTWDDKPENLLPWVDTKKRRLMVVEMYHQEGGQWRRCVFFAGGVLVSETSPYLDEYDQPCCPIEASSCFIDRENRRYGVVQSMIPLQDEINARASRALHLTNMRQLEAADPTGVVPPMTSADEARIQASKADGVIPPGWKTVSTSDMASGNLALLADAKAEIDRQAPTPAVLGQSGSDTSGRSKQVSEQAGLTELARPLGRFEDWENRIWRQVWNRMRQDWTDAMWVRVTDEEGVADFLQVNEPIMGPVQQPVIDPQTGQPAIDPMTGQPMMQTVMGQVGTKNRIAEMDMDIEIEVVPASANLDAETFEALLNQAPIMVQAYGPKATFDALWTLNPAPQKNRVREILKKGAEEMEQQQQQQAQAAQQAQQQAMAMEGQKVQAETAETAASAQAHAADAQKTRVETERLMAEPIFDPNQAPM